MKHMLVAVFLVSFTLYQASGIAINPRLVDGVEASIEDFPYAISLRNYDNCHSCGGFIIGDKWALTAARCIDAFAIHNRTSNVLYGSTDSHQCKEAETQIRVVKAYKHENYRPYEGYMNDIAVLELEESFPFSSTVAPVSLPELNAATPELTEAKLYGWGYDQLNGKVSTALKSDTLTILNHTDCAAVFPSMIVEKVHLCAGHAGQGTCIGDAGGALTVEGVAYGLVSWSYLPCGEVPTVFTKVSHYIDWIGNITGSQ